MVAGVACSGDTAPSPVESGSTFRTHQDVLVIVGVDAEHVVITEPLVEVFPAAQGVPAVIRLTFESVGMLGIEGAIGFASVHARDGTVVLDQIVDLGGDTVEMPGGEYTMRLYYRPCDGNCGLLDPAQEWCAFEHTFVAGADYDLTVTGGAAGSADCELQEVPS